MLQSNPQKKNLAGLYSFQEKNPATHYDQDFGITTEPTGYSIPQFNLAFERRGPQEVSERDCQAKSTGSSTDRIAARLTIWHHADQGVNRSVYLDEGLYETNYTFREDLARNDPGRSPASFLVEWQPGRKRVFIIVTSEIAKLHEKAEKEHLKDFTYAYEQTLGVAEKALRQLERCFGPFDSEEKAREVILRNFHRNLPKELHRLGMDMKRWGNEYLRLCQKSKNRDEKGWHSFGLEQVAEAELIDQSDPQYLTGRQRAESGRIYLRLTRGTTKIGLYESSTVITYDRAGDLKAAANGLRKAS